MEQKAKEGVSQQKSKSKIKSSKAFFNGNFNYFGVKIRQQHKVS
jgi:hypothetical protein